MLLLTNIVKWKQALALDNLITHQLSFDTHVVFSELLRLCVNGVASFAVKLTKSVLEAPVETIQALIVSRVFTLSWAILSWSLNALKHFIFEFGTQSFDLLLEVVEDF